MSELERFDRTMSRRAARRAAAFPENSDSGTELLLVDDDPDMLRAMVFTLQGLWKDMRIETARDGEEAMSKLSRIHPDLVIADLNMHEINGLEVCRAVKRSRGLSHAKVLMITAQQDPEVNWQAFEDGADEFMTKPFSPADLRRSAVRLLGLGLLSRQQGSA